MLPSQATTSPSGSLQLGSYHPTEVAPVNPHMQATFAGHATQQLSLAARELAWRVMLLLSQQEGQQGWVRDIRDRCSWAVAAHSVVLRLADSGAPQGKGWGSSMVCTAW